MFTLFLQYVTETFRTDAILNTEYHRYFRVIPGTVYIVCQVESVQRFFLYSYCSNKIGLNSFGHIRTVVTK